MNTIGILRKRGEIFIRYKFIFMCTEAEWSTHLPSDLPWILYTICLTINYRLVKINP